MIVLAAIVAVSAAVVVGPGPLAYPAAIPAYPKLAIPAVAKVAGPEPYDPNPQYSYSYNVHVSI